MRVEDVALAAVIGAQVGEHLQGQPLGGASLLGGAALANAPRPAVLEVVLHAAVPTHLLLGLRLAGGVRAAAPPVVLLKGLVELIREKGVCQE